MSLPTTLVSKTARAADAALTTFPVGMVDLSGTGVGPFLPVHLAIGADGTPQVPALDATLQEVLTALQSPPQGGSVTVSNQISGFALDGTDATGVTAPAGGSGIRGWLSGIYAALKGTLAVSATALPLPSNAAKETGGALATLAANSPALGQATSAASVPVVLSSDGPFTTNFGAKADTAATSDAGAFSLIALTKRSLGYLATLAGTVASGALQIAVRSNAPRVSTTLALAAQGATVTLAVDGMTTGVAQITGTWAGSISWAGSIDGGATYFAMNVTPFGAGGGASVGAATANGQWEFSAAGLTHIQATMTAFTSGSASVLLAASSGGKIARVKAPAGDPLPVASPIPSAVVTGQVKIAATGTAVPLPSNALVNGVVIKAKSTNAAQTSSYSGMVGPAGVTTTYDGTGSGYPLAPGEATSFAVPNANLIYVNGTAGDVFSYEGN